MRQEKRGLDDVKVVEDAYEFFKIFKGLIVDLILSFKERDESRNFFNSISAEDALKVKKYAFDKFDVELTYSLLFGAIGLDTLSFLMAIFSNWTVVTVLEKFTWPRERSPHWALNLFRISPQCISLFRNFLSLKKSKKVDLEPDKHKNLTAPLPFRRWPESVSGHNLIRYCFKECPSKIHNLNHSYLGIDKIFRQYGITNNFCQCIKTRPRKFTQLL
ncbi:hypothetical protein GH714_002365 [Hevea brasiliensis]|uniref:DUF4220 domain-containing protein n=1 Tax=Hevea brasiliensis TaxID=3981 RepID=A0A6A6KWX7_HEVBR|nr:hypothetical protein GH714_002365 [Hevea brasiliensis]